jgi:hypothetical protein
LPSRAPLAFSRQRLLGANRDHRPLLLGERGIDVLEGARFAALASRWWPLRPIHPVKRSRGRDSRMTSPSGRQSREISPPSWPVTVARVRVAPNPSPSGAEVIAGPPRSVHVRARVCPCSALTISICPFGAESAPYFAEFVPNSCSRSARLETAEPEIARSGPAIVIRSPCASSMLSWGAMIVRMRDCSVVGFALRIVSGAERTR